MATEKYDVVVIGAGAAGLSIAAVLAQKEKKKVLVVEQQEFIGGRLLSFVGGKNNVDLLGKKLDAKGLVKACGAVRGRVVKSTPDLETLVSKGYLDGYTFEAGVHATFWGNKGRMAEVLKYVGKPVDMPGNYGFSVVDPKTNKIYEQKRGGSYDWMTPEANQKTKEILREMATMSLEQASKLEGKSVAQFIEERTKDRQVYEYLKGLASIHMVMGEGQMMPAQDFVKFMVIAKDIGMNLLVNSTGLVGKPGFIKIAVKLAEAVKEAGGVIRTGTTVEKVLASGNKATGVAIKTKTGTEEIEAKQVVCTVPPKHVFGIVPPQTFPANFEKTMREKFFGAGMLSGFVGMNGDILEGRVQSNKTWFLVPAIISEKKGYIGDVDIIMFMSSYYCPELAPPGKHLWIYSVALTDKETREDSKVLPIIEETRKFMKATFPTYDKYTDWELWTSSDEGYGIVPPIGVKRPDVKAPGVEGLFFAGDGYGEKRWGMGLDSAIHSAVLCMDAVTGKKYTEIILPPYHR